MSAISVGLGFNTKYYGVSETQFSTPLRKASVDGGSSIRSASSMQGLLQAENGEGMVELDAGNGTSGFKQGSRITPDSINLDSCIQSVHSDSTFIQVGYDQWSKEKASLARHGTLLTSNASPSRNAAELKSILGNSYARLKSGASIVPVGPLSSVESTSLEQAKPRARVEVDVIPETNIFVQGGYINGSIKIRIRPRSRTESEVLISDGKIRVVGFECIQNEEKRHTFYQQSVSLSDASPSAELLLNSPPDNEGFYAAKEGVHVLPFSMYLMLEGGEGTPKGTISPHAGMSIRYILMISVKVREVETERRSIAHFYRNCEVWPRLNPSAMLSPADQPIRESDARSLFMGGSGKVGLTASLHRTYWVAGQQCCVKVRIINKSKKTIKNLNLTLLRSTVAYRPNPSLDVEGTDEHDADACQTSTTQNQVAESVLEMGQRDHTRGHASAKGWWAGVRPEETTEFCHFLSIPSDAITIPRARLLEVAYNIRVTISAGPLASNIHVVLPIRIINFLSIDPPPSCPRENQALLDFLGKKPPTEINEAPEEQIYVPATFNGRVLEPLSEDDAVDAEYDGELCPETDSESMSGRSSCSQTSLSEDLTASDADTQPRQLGNAAAHDDNDDFVQQAVAALKVDAKYGECGGRFADLYYSSMPQDSRQQYCSDSIGTCTPRPPTQEESSLTSPQINPSAIPDPGVIPKPTRLRGSSSFAERVQQKLQHKDHDRTHEISIRQRQVAAENTSLVCSESLDTSSCEPSVGQSKHGDGRASSRGTTELGRQRSPTAGSYFRPREEIPDEVENLDEIGDEDTSSRPHCSLAPGGASSKTDSRVLPIPPSNSMTDHPSQSASSVLRSAVDSGTQDQNATPQPFTQVDFENTATKMFKPITARARSHRLSNTPSHMDYPVSLDGFSLKASVGRNSVKDRIRILEEKAKAEKGPEDSGPL